MNKDKLTLPKDETDSVIDRFKLAKKQQKRQIVKFRMRRLTMLLGTISGLVILAFLFITSSAAKVQSISFTDPLYLHENYILDKLGLSYQDNYFLISPLALEFRFQSLELLKLKVTKTANRSINIAVEPVDILGYYNSGGKIYFLLASGKSVLYKTEYYALLSVFPYLVGYDQIADAEKLAQSLQVIKQPVIRQISEIERFATTYDENMLKLTMEDGNRAFVAIKSLSLINEYESVVKELKKQHVCIFFYTNNQTNTAYTDRCPE